jgi:site-specific DNA-methyltransferase (adenine-specific)
VDAIITDPPYGTTNLEWDHKIDLVRLWIEFKRLIKPGGVIVMFSAQPFATDLINSNRAWFRYEIIWKKTAPIGFLDANSRPMRLHENILVFCDTFRRSNDGKRAAMTYNPQMTIGKPYSKRAGNHRASHYKFERLDREVVNSGTRFPVDVLEVPNRSGKAYHPTQKPVELMEWLVRTYSHESELVLDPFAGGGSTLIACAKTGRRGVGIEREEKYVEMIALRINELT